MIERVRLVRKEPKRERDEPNRITFTDLGIRRLKPPKQGQELYWDKGQTGLALLVSSGGTKTFRSSFKLHGQWIARSIGRFGEMVANGNPNKENIQIGKARDIVANDRASAKEGIDPRLAHSAQKPSAKPTYGAVVDSFINLYAKPRQRTWDQTQRILLVNCAPWLNKPITDIGKKDAFNLLDGFNAIGHGPKAAVTLAWMKKLWRWAWERDIVSAPIMDAVKIDFERHTRDRVYSDDEITAIWRAANALDPVAGAYVKLLILLAPRKTALARMRLSDLDNADNPTLWTTPFDLTKSRKTSAKKRAYLTPLAPLAQRIIKGLSGDDYLFPTLPIRFTQADRPMLADKALIRQLVAHGAPKDFSPHVMRHTIASWLETAGHDEWERSLVLNHSGSGVTAGYSHGHPLDLKRELLTKWADHIEKLVQPAEGVTVFR